MSLCLGGNEVSSEQRLHKLFRIERKQVSGLLTYADIAYRYAQFARDRDYDATLGRSVQFSKYDSDPWPFRLI